MNATTRGSRNQDLLRKVSPVRDSLLFLLLTRSLSIVVNVSYDEIWDFCEQAIKAGTLTGPFWQSAAPNYRNIVGHLTNIVVTVFDIAVGSHKLENLETGWPGLASVVGGIECFGMAQRHETDLLDRERNNVKDWTCRENTTYSG